MKNEKIKFYSPINEEAGVMMAFAKMHEQLGFPKIVSSSSRGFDIKDIEYVDDIGIHRVTVEFEYLSSNYLNHGYQNLMRGDKKYIVVCWEDDCNLSKTLFSLYKKSLYKIIELKNMIEIVPDEITSDTIEQKYYLINYNPKNADNMSYSTWINSNMYRFKNNNNIRISNGSKALIKQGNYIVGGFDIVRFSNIKLSNNNEFIELYKNLTDYPVGLFVNTVDEIRDNYVNRYVGHIFYNNFYEIGNTKLRKTIQDMLPNFKVSYGPVQSLTEEQYDKLLGNK